MVSIVVVCCALSLGMPRSRTLLLLLGLQKYLLRRHLVRSYLCLRRKVTFFSVCVCLSIYFISLRGYSKNYERIAGFAEIWRGMGEERGPSNR